MSETQGTGNKDRKQADSLAFTVNVAAGNVINEMLKNGPLPVGKATLKETTSVQLPDHEARHGIDTAGVDAPPHSGAAADPTVTEIVDRALGDDDTPTRISTR